MLIFRALVLTLLFNVATIVAAAESVDINSANAEALAETLTGVGLKRAEDIVAFRKDNGPFKSIDDLVLVKGIGASTVEKNRDRISLK